QLHKLPPARLGELAGSFHDPRLPELLFRYRARNWPDTLDPQERQRWQDYCRRRLDGELPGAGVSFTEFDEKLAEAAPRMPPALVAQLQQYAASLKQDRAEIPILA